MSATTGKSKTVTHESKAEITLQAEGLPQCFRDLAALLEGGPGGTLNGIDVAGFAKLKVEVKRKDGRLQFKVKAKHEAPAAVAAEGAVRARPAGSTRAVPAKTAPPKPAAGPAGAKYGSLKKRLKGPWKDMRAAAEAGVLPAAEAIAAFVAGSEAMIAFPGKGDEYYAPYREALAVFQEAVRRKDAAAFAEAVAGLDRVKAQCHARYK